MTGASYKQELNTIIACKLKKNIIEYPSVADKSRMKEGGVTINRSEKNSLMVADLIMRHFPANGKTIFFPYAGTGAGIEYLHGKLNIF